MPTRLILVCSFLALFLRVPCVVYGDCETRHDPEWLTEYAAAMERAKQERRMMLIYFHEHEPSASARAFENAVSSEPIRTYLEKFVPVRLPIDVTVPVEGRAVRLLDHRAFAEMRHRPGVAIIDFTDSWSPNYHSVVSVFPFSGERVLDRQWLTALLQLPRGSLTQRTLILAVRAHPERPHSTDGRLHSVLEEESKKHAIHQASIKLQGHHNWENRFHQINARLNNGMAAQEVCAESWPGQDLLDAAIECVDSWRQSSGHWNAVRSRQSLFGFDMKRGRNGVWYATGIFARP